MNDWREQYRDHLFHAMVLREDGNNKEALRMLDAALSVFKLQGSEVVARNVKPGRPPGASAKHDKDGAAMLVMSLEAKRRGIDRAETLARLALKVSAFRTRPKDPIHESDVKRLARKWKAHGASTEPYDLLSLISQFNLRRL